MNPALIVFVSPIKKHPVRPEFFFQIVQPGGHSALKLTYPTHRAATLARETIIRGQQSYIVPTLKLFAAIADALQVPHNQRQPGTFQDEINPEDG